MRPCGDCTACCTSNKWTCGHAYGHKFSNGESCKFLCETGCGIHKIKPKHCKEISCAWAYELISEEMKPNKCGIISFYTTPENPLHANFLTIMPVNSKEEIDKSVLEYFKEWGIKMNTPVLCLSEDPYFLLNHETLKFTFDGVEYL
jgi:hypothetical protein